jgi:hypothetical protein
MIKVKASTVAEALLWAFADESNSSRKVQSLYWTMRSRGCSQAVLHSGAADACFWRYS